LTFHPKRRNLPPIRIGGAIHRAEKSRIVAPNASGVRFIAYAASSVFAVVRRHCLDRGWRAALLFGGRDVKNGGRIEPDHDLVVAAARAVLASLREPVEQRQLPRAAMVALKMLETALQGDVGRATRR
jgi:hypothetical protein